MCLEPHCKYPVYSGVGADSANAHLYITEWQTNLYIQVFLSITLSKVNWL